MICDRVKSATAEIRSLKYHSMKMEGLEIPEDLRAKLMAHLGVSGNKIFSKKIERYQDINFHKIYVSKYLDKTQVTILRRRSPWQRRTQ